MTAQVRVLPSGHEFRVEEGETLLEGALRSGLNMNYHCNSGSCGECRARILSGEPGRRLHHDYVLSEQEKRDRVVLMCRTHAQTDLEIEAGEAHGVEDIPEQSLEAQVTRLERPEEEVMILHLRTPRTSTLRFLAGQHVTLHIEGLAPRSKSIASCPCNGMILQFHVRRVPGDPFSDYVFNELRPRQKIRVQGPYGNFLLDEESPRPKVFIAFETGFAPIKSLIEHAIALEQGHPMRLYWVARDEAGLYLANQCRAWEDALDEFSFHPLVTGTPGPGEGGIPGQSEKPDPVLSAMVQAASRVAAELPELAECDVYVNGAESMLTPLRTLLLGHGLPEAQLHIDHVRRH